LRIRKKMERKIKTLERYFSYKIFVFTFIKVCLCLADDDPILDILPGLYPGYGC
jgi:hypothetical protein